MANMAWRRAVRLSASRRAWLSRMASVSRKLSRKLARVATMTPVS
ncbi:MAG: hypothetical protein WDN06_03610 [Asticcacaulis sp.]